MEKCYEKELLAIFKDWSFEGSSEMCTCMTMHTCMCTFRELLSKLPKGFSTAALLRSKQHCSGGRKNITRAVTYCCNGLFVNPHTMFASIIVLCIELSDFRCSCIPLQEPLQRASDYSRTGVLHSYGEESGKK